MSTSPKLDNNCELVFDNGICEIVTDKKDLIQAIRVELEQNKGQFALNTAWGTPYLNDKNTGLLQTKNNKKMIISEITKIIKKYNGIEKINFIDFIDKKLVIKIQIDGREYEL